MPDNVVVNGKPMHPLAAASERVLVDAVAAPTLDAATTAPIILIIEPAPGHAPIVRIVDFHDGGRNIVLFRVVVRPSSRRATRHGDARVTVAVRTIDVREPAHHEAV